MKSTYKLLGVFWDGCPVENKLATRSRMPKAIRDCNYIQDLFDIDGYERKISIQLFFDVESQDDFSKILSQIRYCTKIYIDCRNLPKAKSSVIMQFETKRIFQIAYVLKAEITNTKTVFVIPKSLCTYFSNMKSQKKLSFHAL